MQCRAYYRGGRFGERYLVLHAGGPGDRVAHSRGKWKFTAPKWNRERTSGVREFERRSMARPNAKRGSLNHLTLIVCNVRDFEQRGSCNAATYMRESV